MNREQAIKLWKEVRNTTFKMEIITRLKNKPGYGGKRTLERYIQAQEGFEQGLEPSLISMKTGWSPKTVKKLYRWWQEEFVIEPAICSASPEGRTVSELESWGVPRGKAANLFNTWEKYHECGEHDICKAFLILREDIQTRKIPFKQAVMLLFLNVNGIEFHVEEAVELVNEARAYQPWKHAENWRVFREKAKKINLKYEIDVI